MRNSLIASTAILLSMGTAAIAADVSDGKVKIGILNDQSGVYADFGGKWSYEAAKMAVEDYGGRPAHRSRSSPPTIRTRPTSPPTSPANGTTPNRSTASWS